tara:strand:+ start:22826 stop:23209 length:384 start_codon:yes stop_codon:yes gene_type:complete
MSYLPRVIVRGTARETKKTIDGERVWNFSYSYTGTMATGNTYSPASSGGSSAPIAIVGSKGGAVRGDGDYEPQPGNFNATGTTAFWISVVTLHSSTYKLRSNVGGGHTGAGTNQLSDGVVVQSFCIA